jgi:hypothetical protein
MSRMSKGTDPPSCAAAPAYGIARQPDEAYGLSSP